MERGNVRTCECGNVGTWNVGTWERGNVRTWNVRTWNVERANVERANVERANVERNSKGIRVWTPWRKGAPAFVYSFSIR